MLQFIKRLFLIFNYGSELDEIIADMRRKQKEEARLATQHHLHLCSKHQQEVNRCHYSEDNCDYCRLLRGHHRPQDQK